MFGRSLDQHQSDGIGAKANVVMKVAQATELEAVFCFSVKKLDDPVKLCLAANQAQSQIENLKDNSNGMLQIHPLAIKRMEQATRFEV